MALTSRSLLAPTLCLALACSPGSGSPELFAPDAGATAPGDAAADGASGAVSCAFEAPLSKGRACAIDPTTTAAGVTSTFGFHGLGLPASITEATPVYVHFVGTYGDPARPETRAFPNRLLMDEATTRDALVILPAYDNEPGVKSLCAEDLACYEAVRREILIGEDAPAPHGALKDVRPPNDIRSRLDALVGALWRSGLLGAAPPAALAGGKLDWSRARLSGHSQGGGQAALLAKSHAVERLCMFSSPIDGAGSGATATAVPWVSGTWATDVSRRRAIIHEDDRDFDKARKNFEAMGLVEDTHWRRLRFATSDPHAATVKEASARAAREACLF